MISEEATVNMVNYEDVLPDILQYSELPVEVFIDDEVCLMTQCLHEIGNIDSDMLTEMVAKAGWYVYAFSLSMLTHGA